MFTIQVLPRMYSLRIQMVQKTLLDLVGLLTQSTLTSSKLKQFNGGKINLHYSSHQLTLMVYGWIRMSLRIFVTVHVIKISILKTPLEITWLIHQLVKTSKINQFLLVLYKVMGNISNLTLTLSTELKKLKPLLNTSRKIRRELLLLRSLHSQEWANMDQDGLEIANLAINIWNCL